MPSKIKELKRQLKQAGFTRYSKRGKGSHDYWKHPDYPKPVILANKDGDDAKPYQEQQVREAIKAIEEKKQ